MTKQDTRVVLYMFHHLAASSFLCLGVTLTNRDIHTSTNLCCLGFPVLILTCQCTDSRIATQVRQASADVAQMLSFQCDGICIRGYVTVRDHQCLCACRSRDRGARQAKRFPQVCRYWEFFWVACMDCRIVAWNLVLFCLEKVVHGFKVDVWSAREDSA